MQEMIDSPLLLAYLGDAVMEVLVRRYVIGKKTNSADCNVLALQFVTAKSQSEAIKGKIELLTEEEQAIFTRGKNAKSNSGPRNIDPYSYRLATGLEAVFGYNELKGNRSRNEELFELLFFH
ncbi:MAG: ribonuclease III [Ruminococcaceae bacterium]|nr:ribonuclease III [Oscillospiraceae bacterium]